MTMVPIHKDRQIVGNPCVLDAQVAVVPGHLLGPLQHLVHLGQIDIRQQRRDHPALGTPRAPDAVSISFSKCSTSSSWTRCATLPSSRSCRTVSKYASRSRSIT